MEKNNYKKYIGFLIVLLLIGINFYLIDDINLINNLSIGDFNGKSQGITYYNNILTPTEIELLYNNELINNSLYDNSLLNNSLYDNSLYDNLLLNNSLYDNLLLNNSIYNVSWNIINTINTDQGYMLLINNNYNNTFLEYQWNGTDWIRSNNFVNVN